MNHFIELLPSRNPPLFIFGCLNFLSAAVFLLLTRISKIMLRGVNTWFKPCKFALSIGVFAWTMAWYTAELNAPDAVVWYSGATIVFLGFEVVYIALQAGRGQLSHYNTTSATYSALTALMAVAAVLATLWTGYMGLLFFGPAVRPLPGYYVISIRMGILLFVFFAFQGASMGARGTHTVGGPEGTAALPVLNWSTRYGDLRIAHFVGMHALQVLPFLSWYLLKSTTMTLLVALLYAALAVFTLARALKGKPLIAKKRFEMN
jgi:hypothetical protein